MMYSDGKSVVHFHGTPVWGNKGEVLNVATKNGGAFVSFARPDQIDACLNHCKEIGIDNGAFSIWKSGLTIDWAKEFYPWLLKYYFHPKVKFFIIPDVIEGTEEENDQLINQVPKIFLNKAVPVWHLHESIERLVRLCKKWPRVAFGSSGQYSTIRTKAWHSRMNEAFEAIEGINVKIHGLRMLDGRVLGNYPLDTADSTNLACNIPKWIAKYPHIGLNILKRSHSFSLLIEHVELNSAFKIIKKKKYVQEKILSQIDKSELLIHRAAVLRGAIESVTPPPRNKSEACIRAKGAYITHGIRTSRSEREIITAIEMYRERKIKVTKSAIAKEVGLSREQITRRYKHLFAA